MSLDQTVQDAKRYGVYHCTQFITLREAVKRMVQEDVSALAVMDDEGYLVGILSRIDIIRARVVHKDWGNQPVYKHMVPEVITVTTNTRLEDVANLLVEKNIHRVVVVREENGKKRPVSVVSAADIVYHMSKNE